VTVHAGTEMELPLPYLDSPLKLRHFFDAALAEGQPETAALNATAAAEFALAKHLYNIKAKQVVIFNRAEVYVKIEEDDNPIYDRVFSKAINWL
jgi:hypothetical protein